MQRYLVLWVEGIKLLLEVLSAVNTFSSTLHCPVQTVSSVPQNGIFCNSFHRTPGKACRAQQQFAHFNDGSPQN